MDLKICVKCNIEKPLSEYHKNPTYTSGYMGHCKSCRSYLAKIHRENNKEKLKEKAKKYREENKEVLKQKKKEDYERNREKRLAKMKATRDSKKEKYKIKSKNYYIKNADRIKKRVREYSKNNKDKVYQYVKNKIKSDPFYAARAKFRSLTSTAFARRGYKKDSRTEELLGCSFEVAKAHIERQFKKGMSWKNRSEWHLDHKIPLASAKTIDELKVLCHYTNLQPLWKEENLSKHDKILPIQTTLTI